MTESSSEGMENVEGIIDLTLPIRKHWRWGFHRTYERDYAFGDPLREEYLYMPVHCFTHIDPPSHATEDDKTIDQIPLSDLIGHARIVDLSHKEQNAEITDADLDEKGGHVSKGDIVVVKTCQGLRYSVDQQEFWTTSPYMGESSGKWLVEKGVRAVAFDFPQDYVLRDFFKGIIPTLDDMTMHKALLKAGIIQIEYITNLHLVEANTVLFFAIPLRLEGVAGSPARVFAMENTSSLTGP